jgi:hypothetical protein
MSTNVLFLDEKIELEDIYLKKIKKAFNQDLKVILYSGDKNLLRVDLTKEEINKILRESKKIAVAGKEPEIMFMLGAQTYALRGNLNDVFVVSIIGSKIIIANMTDSYLSRNS